MKTAFRSLIVSCALIAAADMAPAQAAPVNGLNIDSLTLDLTDANGLALRHYDFGAGALQMYSYQRRGAIVADLVDGPLGLGVLTAPSAPPLDAGLHAWPSGEVQYGSLSLDLGAWYLQSYDAASSQVSQTFYQGQEGLITPVDANNRFTLRWQGADPVTLGGQQAYTRWSIDGTALTSPVPVPAALWLLGSGIIGLLGLMPRRASSGRR